MKAAVDVVTADNDAIVCDDVASPVAKLQPVSNLTHWGSITLETAKPSCREMESWSNCISLADL